MALVDCTVLVDASQVVLSTGASASVIVEPVTTTVEVTGLVGIRGPKGETGDAGTAIVTQPYEAGTNLSGHRAIRSALGVAYLCDGTDASHIGRAIGISTGAALAGANVDVQTIGQITEPSWAWADGPVYVGASGVLTQSLSGLAYIHQIGIAVSATSIDINPISPIAIS